MKIFFQSIFPHFQTHPPYNQIVWLCLAKLQIWSTTLCLSPPGALTPGISPNAWICRWFRLFFSLTNRPWQGNLLGISWHVPLSFTLSGPPCINEMSSQVLLGQCDLACGFHRSRKCLVAGSLPWYGWATGGYLDIVADSSGLQVPCGRDGDSTVLRSRSTKNKENEFRRYW